MKKPAWVSLSWQVDSVMNVQPGGLKALLDSDAVFVAVSAGNEDPEVRADLFPQNGASIFPQFVNVTYGTPDGGRSAAGRARRAEAKSI